MKIVHSFPYVTWFIAVLVTLAAAESTAMKTSRRIIVNDDGEVLLPVGERDWDRYLDERLRHVLGTQVDSYFLNIGATDRGPGIVHSLQSTMAYWAAGKEAPSVYDEATRRYVSLARRADIEIFASIRMNDVHDARAANLDSLTYPLKKGRPDLLLGNVESMRRGQKAYAADSIMAQFWPGLNWCKGEVRQHFLEFIEWYCQRHDFDGLELDYYRHPLFFKFGEEEQNMATMTAFVRQVRQALNEIGRKRGRPYLLASRMPDTPALARRIGLDAEAWLREGLMDLLIVGGGNMPYGGRLKEFINLAHPYGVTVYPCVNYFRAPVQMRSLASNFWALGGDGFYLFNFFGVTGEEVSPGWGASDAISLREIGSAAALRRKDKVYLAEMAEPRNWHGYPETDCPVWIVDGRTITLVVGDDVRAAEKEGWLKKLLLEFTVTNVAKEEKIVIKVNGIRVLTHKIMRIDDATFGVNLTPSSLNRGLNQFNFSPGKNSAGRLGSRITGLKLSVDYN